MTHTWAVAAAVARRQSVPTSGGQAESGRPPPGSGSLPADHTADLSPSTASSMAPQGHCHPATNEQTVPRYSPRAGTVQRADSFGANYIQAVLVGNVARAGLWRK